MICPEMVTQDVAVRSCANDFVLRWSHRMWLSGLALMICPEMATQDVTVWSCANDLS